MTTPGKFYNIRSRTIGYWSGSGEKRVLNGHWIGQRKNGKSYWKLWRKNSVAFAGGPELDQRLRENLDWEAVEDTELGESERTTSIEKRRAMRAGLDLGRKLKLKPHLIVEAFLYALEDANQHDMFRVVQNEWERLTGRKLRA